MLTVRIQEKNYSESIMVLKLKDGYQQIFRKKQLVIKFRIGYTTDRNGRAPCFVH